MLEQVTILTGRNEDDLWSQAWVISPGPVVCRLLPQPEERIKSSSGGEIGGMTVAEMPLWREKLREISTSWPT